MQRILAAVVTILFLAFPLCLDALCSPAPSVQCKSNGGGCEIFNSEGIWEDRSICKAAEAASPKTEAELLHAVARAVKNKKKIKVVSTLAHSLSKLVCVGDNGLIISTENYASVIGVNKTAMTITVQGGAMMRDIIEEAAKEGLALPAMIYWNGVSAAGVVSTGAHGSSLKGKGSGVYEYVVGMRLVVPASPSEGYAKLISLTEADQEDLKATRLSLGTLGVISQLTFSLQPMFKRSLITPILKEDNGLDKEASRFLKAHDFADILWFPFHRVVLFRPIDRVPLDATGDGLHVAIGQPTRVVDIDIENADALVEEVQATEDYEGLCNSAGEQIITLVANGSGFWNDGIKGFTGYPVTGFNHRMQSSGGCQGTYRQLHQHDTSGCTSTEILDKNQTVCSWDRRVTTSFSFDVELRVPMSRLPEAVNDIKKIRDLNPESMCESYVVFRSIKKSDAYLGPAKDLVTLEIVYIYRPKQPNTPKWNEDIFEEIEQMVIEKHGGTLHWGKSGGYLFGGLAKRAVNLEKFLQVKNRYDPEGLFSNEWTDGLLGIGGKGVEELRDGCALDKMCKCREDKHCAPEKGYFCRPGRVWKQARVCRKLD